MITVTCDICGKEIDEDHSDGEATRLQIGDNEFLYVVIGDDEGDPTGDHICFDCLTSKLQTLQEDWAQGIDLSSAFSGDDEEGEGDENADVEETEEAEETEE